MSTLNVTGELRESKTFEWKFPNSSSFFAISGLHFRSPSFTFEDDSCFFEIDNDGFGSLSVYVTNETGSFHHVTCSVSIRASGGKLTRIKTATIDNNFYYFYFKKKEILEQGDFDLLSSDTLTLICNLEPGMREKVRDKSAVETSEHMRIAETDVLSKNFSDLFTNKEYCDTVLRVKGKEFEVHKIVLIARSPVFAAMFRHDTSEKQTGIITIPDCYSDSFHEFLEYLYCGKLEDVTFDSAVHLYRTSDKYDVQELKNFCMNYMMQNLSVQNVCHAVILAEEYDETELFNAAQRFFNKNLKGILVTSEWQSLLKMNDRLANKLLIEMSCSKK